MRTFYLLRRRAAPVLLLLPLLVGLALAQENPNDLPPPDSVTVAGTVQSVLGCPGDWQPECSATHLTYDPDQDLWIGTFELPAGSYEYKAALNNSWDDNYGLGGTYYGPNIPLVLDEDTVVTFVYDHKTGIISDSVSGEVTVTLPSADRVVPDMVNIPGTLQQALGCPGIWAPDCPDTALSYNETFDLWIGTFDLPAGSYEYKVAINGSWAENYGAFADRDGPNIPLVLAEDTTVTFIYDHKSNWISDDVRHLVVTAPGDYQSEIGCTGDWQPECLLSWLQDVDGDGIYQFSTRDIPAGDYEAKVTVGLSWDENYGAGGVADGPNIAFSVPSDGTNVTFVYDPSLTTMVVSAGGGAVSASNLREARAHWVLGDTIAWNVEVPEDGSFRLLYSADASMTVSLFGLSGDYAALDLTVNPDGLDSGTRAKFPHLADYTALNIAADDLDLVPDILRGQFVVAMYGADGGLLNLTGLQIPGVLDDLYAYDGPLGLEFGTAGVPTVRVWAPTARSVTLHLFDDSRPQTTSTTFYMAREAASGVWSVTGAADWNYKYYLFEVEVYAPSTGEIVTNLVTDPYSVSLSMNSLRSQIVDLMNDPALMPEGWLTYQKPVLEQFTDIVLYELHIRDFSIFDETVPEEYRGTYMAFTVAESDGMRHLTALAQAGLTHLHLLPSFDIATINENRPRHFAPDYAALAAMPPDSEGQQAAIDPIRDLDGFNWGYDPYHFNVPEGSYATDPGVQRILEYRMMVMALNEAGLRVVMDVVYNHTNASGQSDRSVFDRIVPGYYHRLDERGTVARSTCCANTATEHYMMERFMVESVILWSTAYKIDGYRFDLMGHHMLDNMLLVRQALNGLTLEADGVDGPMIYVYGEGWDFGEVANNARGINATQLNVGGTGIGVFNDRLRDAARGGNPFGGWQEQGFITGLFTDPNGITPGTPEEQLARLLLFSDQIRIGLAGNLRDYTFIGMTGEPIMGHQIDYNGSPAGYTLLPQENIVYVSAHDNETLFDAIQYKAPESATVADRVRMQNLGISVVGFSQGVPFYHAGVDMLRSKSMDRNSYNSGDWFNRLDFAYQTNNFGVGLPPAWDNRSNWEIQAPILANPDIVPGPDDILSSVMHMQEVLAIRASSPLFRLTTAEDVQARLAFHNTGPDQVPGLIVMSISDNGDLEDLDPAHEMLVVLFNASPDEVSFSVEALAGLGFKLHPLQVTSHDPVVREAAYASASGTFMVPGRTTAVFVLPQG